MSNITVITPFFNEEETLRFTIDALLRQSLRAERILMVDSGSNDSSAEIIKGYINSNHMSIELLQPMLGSPSSSINYGLKNVKTKYVAYVDSLRHVNLLELTNTLNFLSVVTVLQKYLSLFLG